MPLSPAQTKIVEAPQRFKVVIAGRRFGKTHLSIRELCYNARLPNKDVIYCAPTYKQAKNIVWKKLKLVMPMIKLKIICTLAGKASENRGIFNTIWRTFIMPHSYYNEDDL